MGCPLAAPEEIGTVFGYGDFKATVRYTHLARDVIQGSAERVVYSIGAYIL